MRFKSECKQPFKLYFDSLSDDRLFANQPDVNIEETVMACFRSLYAAK